MSKFTCRENQNNWWSATCVDFKYQYKLKYKQSDTDSRIFRSVVLYLWKYYCAVNSALYTGNKIFSDKIYLYCKSCREFTHNVLKMIFGMRLNPPGSMKNLSVHHWCEFLTWMIQNHFIDTNDLNEWDTTFVDSFLFSKQNGKCTRKQLVLINHLLSFLQTRINLQHGMSILGFTKVKAKPPIVFAKIQRVKRVIYMITSICG